MAEQRVRAVSSPVRLSVVIKYSGQLALALAAVTTAPLLFALYQRQWQTAAAFALVCAVLLLAGLISSRLKPEPGIRTNEAMTITALAFILSPLLLSLPLMTTGMAPSDAIFEAVSGVTTTGLSVVADPGQLPATTLFSRAWMQWCGGLGIVVLCVALLIGNETAAHRLVDVAVDSDDRLGSARTHARRTLWVYLWMTGIGFIVILAASGNPMWALLHTLASVSTGGFAPHADSLAPAGAAATTAVLALSLCGATALPLYWRIAHAGTGAALLALLRDVEWRALLFMCLVLALALGALASYHGMADAWYHGLTMAFSAQTTTGFATVPPESLDPLSRVLLIVAMLSGGSIGSSAGGFKLLRLLILLRVLQLALRRLMMAPHAVSGVYLQGRNVEQDDLMQALLIIMIYLLLTVLLWLPFLAYGYDPLNALFEVASAMGTAGMSTGITGPELPEPLRMVLCFAMLAGRLEVLALLTVLAPANWFR